MPAPMQKDVSFKAASLLSQDIETDQADVALVPSLDLIKHPGFFVSSKIAISFDGNLSNSYLYFLPEQNKFSDLYLNGDVSSNEIILSKILFNEKYGTDVQIHLDPNKLGTIDKNYLVIGDENLISNRFMKAMSFADEISEMLFLPYVNFIAVSKNREVLAEFANSLVDLDSIVENDLDKYLASSNFTEELKTYTRENLNSVYFEMTGSEQDGLRDLIQMPYYHGITDDLVEIKLI